MGWFDGFPFVSKEERERRAREFEKRIAPFGVEAQREKIKATLKELFPKTDATESLFAYFDAKDAYTKKETEAEGVVAAKIRLRRHKWIDEKKESIMLRFIELEKDIESLDDFPTAAEILDSGDED